MPRDMAQVKWRSTVATELRLKGYSYNEIAEALEFKCRSGAWRAVHRNLSKLEKDVAQKYLHQTLANIDMLEEKYWPEAMSGRKAAIEKAISLIMARLAVLKQLT
jgi:hypothetical protein